MANLSLRGINKTYPGNVVAVDDFSLEIADKEFIVFVGPSGCGKSTTLRMIAGLEEITSGELYIGDRLVNDVPPKDRDIAMVFQNYALYPHMTVYKNMSFALELRKMPKDEIKRRVVEAARILDIEKYLDRKPKALSGGQRQRVALGRAIVRDPAVFLLDEPLSNLDAKLRTQMRAEISKLHDRLGATFIYVTHDQTEAMTMGDRIVVMKDGVIQQIDAPLNLYANPCNIFVAGFIGSPQINFIDAKIVQSESGIAAEFGEGGKHAVELSADKAELAKPYIGREVIMGIRPEHLHGEEIFTETQSARPKAGAGILDATVELSEMMGAETFLYLSAAGLPLVARISSRRSFKHGDCVKIAPDASKVHLFDKETELAICDCQKLQARP
ncbi:MAG: sn-glycerol-3-phosphate ABC transporter ATP-binding protein UgpC [Synergistaceae bacterium]|jgi:multiple sugar transport system ATP-binding protein|nr:sn-glycerol-3-phosphate ABC transporter ATP-binding protein UgpC [Synergistaceae bacterium]